MQAGRNTALVILMMIIVGGGIAGTAGGYLTGRYLNHFELEEKYRISSLNLPPDQAAEIKLAKHQVDSENNALVLGLIGCILGALLGLCNGWIRRSAAVAVLGLVVVALFGVGFGALGGLGSQLTWKLLADQDWSRLQTQYAMEPATLKAGAAQAAGWMILAAGCALGCGLLVSPRFKSMLKLLLPAMGAALAAGFLTPFVTAVILPNTRADFPVPIELDGQIFWACLACGLIALALGRTVNSLVKTAATPAAAPTPGGDAVAPPAKIKAKA